MGIAKPQDRIVFLMQESRMGGIEHNSVALALALRRRGVNIHFLCPSRGPLTELLDREHLSFEFVERSTFLSTSFKIGRNYFFNPFAALYDFLAFVPIVLRLTAWLKKNRPAVIVTKGLLANFYGSLAARLAGVASIWDMQEIVSPDKAFGLARWGLNLWAKIFPTCITTAAKAIQQQFDPEIQSKTCVIPNGVSLERFHPGMDRITFRGELGLSGETLLVGHIARFTYWKGQREFVETIRWVHETKPDVHFVLVGSSVFENDDYEKSVKRRVKELDLESCVSFRDYRSDFDEALASLDVFVHSSIEPEGCPLTLIYAMAMEKAVVATSVPGNSEIIQDGMHGLLVPPGDSKALAQAILRLLNEPEERKRLGSLARCRVQEKFSMERFAEETLAVMQPSPQLCSLEEGSGASGLVSVILPVRNESRYLAACLESILANDYPKEKLEVLVVDGRSEDHTREIAKGFEKKFHSFKIIDNPEKIAASALNRGLKQAQGEILIRIDGHGKVAPDFIRKCVDTLKITPQAGCVGGAIQPFGETYIAQAISLAQSSLFGGGGGSWYRGRKKGFIDTVMNAAYRRSVFDRAGVFNEKLVRNQDDEFHARLRRAGFKIFFNPEIQGIYFSRATLGRLLRQYFEYGFWKTEVFRKHSGRMRLRNFAAPVFVALLVVLAIGSFWNPVLFFFLKLILGIYLVSSLTASLAVGWTNRWQYVPILPLAFAAMHFGYGLGFWWGFKQLLIRKGSNR